MQTAEYDAALKRYPVPCETRLVDTAFGATHTVISGTSSAPPLVLIHGAAMNALFWLNIIAPLSNRYHVHSLELIGHSGKSAARRLDTRGSGTADWMAQTLDGLGLRQPAIVGTSLGGWVTLKLATRFPERVQRAVLLAPAGITPVRTLEFVSQLVPAALRGQSG
jgi:pimeloyl-ACP methyl ester carboxylesterase